MKLVFISVGEPSFIFCLTVRAGCCLSWRAVASGLISVYCQAQAVASGAWGTPRTAFCFRPESSAAPAVSGCAAAGCPAPPRTRSGVCGPRRTIAAAVAGSLTIRAAAVAGSPTIRAAAVAGGPTIRAAAAGGPKIRAAATSRGSEIAAAAATARLSGFPASAYPCGPRADETGRRRGPCDR